MHCTTILFQRDVKKTAVFVFEVNVKKTATAVMNDLGDSGDARSTSATSA
jgi:hypothetical protein